MTALTAEIRYTDENSNSSIYVDTNAVRISRNGEYSIELNLEEGKKTISRLGIGGSVGEIPTRTEKIAYSLTSNSVLLSLKYALVFGADEVQKMKIRLTARIISEEK